ncbi:hypothetical protein [Legionella longbeachae]|uniref:Uncharacterized protein n=1 Tax=Legionella longbeachae serogroup 1 (strain NSW150) TaxID=661367 RepID=D3HJG0_LEGLN|nr:hypothetical protein [Legionella longbeachae]RZV21439.1 hypothetical protein EKG34_16880 [Legionella longbeachae]UAK46111.1 hypothetical protein K8O86_15290 [Legionella longbeachae]CBJ12552.1 hypothetical protein LLO_2156 [Legionella longbeachae NSW150]
MFIHVNLVLQLHKHFLRNYNHASAKNSLSGRLVPQVIGSGAAFRFREVTSYDSPNLSSIPVVG